MYGVLILIRVSMHIDMDVYVLQKLRDCKGKERRGEERRDAQYVR